jgi:hypothetical protein
VGGCYLGGVVGVSGGSGEADDSEGVLGGEYLDGQDQPVGEFEVLHIVYQIG